MNEGLGVLFNALGFGVGALVYWLEARRRKLDTLDMGEVAMVGVLAGVIAAALVQLVYGWATAAPGESIQGGRTIVGGVIGGWLAVEIGKRRMKIRQSTGPLWALALSAGEAVGRIGCWFHGCCYGRVCDLPIAVHQHEAMRWPTQFMLSGAAVASFAVLWALKDKADIFALGLLFWAVSRMVIEPLRESSIAVPWLVEVVCGFVAVYAVWRLVRGGRRGMAVEGEAA